MKSSATLVIAIAVAALGGFSAQGETRTNPAETATEPSTISERYPRLASGALTHARLSELPKGTLLRAGDLVISQKQLDLEIAKAPEHLREQLKKNAFFLLNNVAVGELLLSEAKRESAGAGEDASDASDREIIEGHLGRLAAKVKVTRREIADFYATNRDMLGGAELDQVEPQIRRHLLEQKQQEAIARHIETLGKRIAIQVSASWAQEQSILAKDNPVDRARDSGKPLFANFGAKGCRPCDMMEPIRQAVKKKYEGSLNVVFVHVQKEQILAARYGVRGIPLLVFFDKDGEEVFRHTGFMPQDLVEKKVAEMGVE